MISPRGKAQRVAPPPLPQPPEPAPAPLENKKTTTTPPLEPPSFGIKLSGTARAASAPGLPVPTGETLAIAPQSATKKGDKKTSPRSAFKTAYRPGEPAPLAVVTTMPRLITPITPSYPEEARDLGLEGRVTLALTIDGTGKVAAIQLLRGLHPLLDAEAISLARKLRFVPAKVNGTPVTLSIRYSVTFVLD
jgi:TonB family protein